MTQPEHQHTTTATRTAESLGRVHFIGIGGVGMSAVARIMVARGLPVSGSDAKDLPVMADLAAAGARICVGYDAANLGDAQSVVAGSAIRPDNPELAAARAAGLPVLHRSEALAAAMAQDTAVTVAGTHGKSTTTSMIAVLLQGAGLDPSFAIGANVPALGVNAASGSTPIFVAEADESDGSFLNYRPQIAVVTNVEPDHLDHYGTAEAVYASFDRFTALLPADGVLVACADDAGARALARGPSSAATPAWCSTAPAMTPSLCCTMAARETWPSARPPAASPSSCTFPDGTTPSTWWRRSPSPSNSAWILRLPLAPCALHGGVPALRIQGGGRGVRVDDDDAHHSIEARAACPRHGQWPVATSCTSSSSRTCFPGAGIRREVRRGAQHRGDGPGPRHLSGPRTSIWGEQPADRRALGAGGRLVGLDAKAVQSVVPPPGRGTSRAPLVPATSRPMGR